MVLEMGWGGVVLGMVLGMHGGWGWDGNWDGMGIGMGRNRNDWGYRLVMRIVWVDLSVESDALNSYNRLDSHEGCYQSVYPLIE